MRIDSNVEDLLDRAQGGRAPSQAECAYLLSFSEASLEAVHTRVAGDATTRRRFGNQGLVFAQIGVEIAPCPGACRFCSFAAGHTAFAPSVMGDDELLSKVESFTAAGELDALFLMTMHTFDLERLIRLVALVRKRIAPELQVVVNAGDFDADQARDPLSANGQISGLRLAQVTAVVALATLGCPETRAIGVHEPNVHGLTSGANSLFAEAGANPRDTQGDTAGHRGRDIGDCKSMLYEAGFATLAAATRRIPLTDAYL